MSAESLMIIVFGATGDLAKRKLIPAFYHLHARGTLSADSPIVCLGRGSLTRAQFIEELEIKKFIPEGSEETRGLFEKTINYHQFDVERADPSELQDIIHSVREKCGCRTRMLFYLALPTSVFAPAVRLIEPLLQEEGWQRVAFEKPFGRDLVSAQELHQDIISVLDEEQIFRVDHYLGKELVQDILSLRFANEIFAGSWSCEAIDHVQITVSESLGVEDRAGYYDKSGAIRDMLQNHLLQLLAFVAMEPPRSGEGNAIRDESAKVIEHLREPGSSDIVIGQYGSGEHGDEMLRSYREEDNIADNSHTETYVALRTYIDTPRWRGVPFYLRTGKRLPERYAKIKVVYRQQELNGLGRGERPNVVTIRIQPDEGIALAINVRKPGATGETESVMMDFCHHCHFGPNTPEAYEAIMASIIKGDPLLFTRWDWLQASWRFIDRVREAAPPVVIYKAGSAGPAEADRLIEKDGRAWL